MNLSDRISRMYKLYFQDVKQYVLHNSGSLDDARDLFQEVVMTFYKMMNQAEDAHIQDEKSYFLGIARNMWLKVLKRNKGDVEFNPVVHQPIAEEGTQEMKNSKLMDLIMKKLDDLSEDCKSLLHEAFFMKKANAELAKLFGYTEQFVKVKKYRCLQGLKRHIQESGEYKLIQIEW